MLENRHWGVPGVAGTHLDLISFTDQFKDLAGPKIGIEGLADQLEDLAGPKIGIEGLADQLKDLAGPKDRASKGLRFNLVT